MLRFPRWLIISGLVVPGVIAVFSRLAAAVVGAVLLLVVAGLYVYFRRSLPVVKGALQVPGLRGGVEIIRDSDYVPHIYGEDKLDAYFGLGYVHAQDRLWQLDFNRRLGQGRLAEVMGPAVLAFDRLTRTLGFYKTAQETWNRMDPAAREMTEAYAAGINAVLAGLTSSRLPVEFLLLRTRPEPWSGSDVVLMSVLMAWNLAGNHPTEILRQRLINAVGPERARQLVPGPFNLEARWRPQPASVSAAAGVTPAAFTERMKDSQSVGEGVGSNMWMVSAEKCERGGPILANDPHLLSANPMTWYLAHLSAPGLDVMGATSPGIPGVIIGRNRYIAWGMTNLNPDVQDLFYEHLDASGLAAEFQGKMEPLTVREETIRVKNKPAVRLQVKSTRHGPIVNEILAESDAKQAADDFLKSCGPVTLQWTGMDPDDASLEAFYQLAEAKNWDEFRKALKLCHTPAITFGYADVYGNIGYHAAGHIPVRRSGDGSLPAEGWTGNNEWTGFIPFDELPHAWNPPNNYLVSINCPPQDPGYPWLLTADVQDTYRLERIEELLKAKSKFTAEDHKAMQADLVSLHARETLPLLLSLVSPADTKTSQAVQLLRDWNGEATKDSVSAAIFIAWNLHLPRVILEGQLSGKLLATYSSWSSWSNHFVQDVLRGNTKVDGTAAQIAQNALQAALRELSKRLGDDINEWRWGRLHTAVLPHMPFHRVSYLRPFFSRSIAVGGDWSTVNLGSYVSSTPFLQRVISGYRQIVDLSRPDGGMFIQAGGQCGHFLSKHFDDFLPDWAAVKYRPMRFERSTVEKDCASRLFLKPQGSTPRSSTASGAD